MSYHNWLYSVVPLFPEKDNYGFEHGGIYLAGYCRNCNMAFTVKLRTAWDHSLTLDAVGVPKDGCVEPKL